MAKVRIGFSTQFEVENEKVGIGTDSSLDTLHVTGDIIADNIDAGGGITTTTTYEGFIDKEVTLTNTDINLDSKVHSLSGEIIIEGDITVSSGTTVTSGPENLTVTDNFTLPGISDDIPTVGTTRFNENLGALEFYTGVEWKSVNSIVDMGNRGRGLFMGGTGVSYFSRIDYISIPTTGNSKNFGDLSADFYLNGAFGSSIRGISGGAYPSPGTVIYEYVTIASEGDAISFGNLATNTTFGRGAASSSTRGLLAGYYPKNVTIEYVEINTLGNGTDFADLTDPRSYPAGMASPTRAVFAGGFYGDSAPNAGAQTSRDTIDYVTIASKSNAADFGSLTAHRIPYDGALSSNTRGVITSSIVYQGPGVNDYSQKIMDYITIASTGNAIEFGETIGNKQGSTATSTQTRGVFMGGQNRSSPGAAVNIIDYITIATTGNSVDFGDMDIAKKYGGGTSDSHGGLGGF